MPPLSSTSDQMPTNMTLDGDYVHVVMCKVVMVYMTCLSAVAALANMTLLFGTVGRQMRLRQVLMVNLTIGDLLCPLLTYWMAISSAYEYKWTYGNVGCIVGAFGNSIFGMMSIGSFIAMSIDRYISLCGSGDQKQFAERHSTAAVFLVWIYALLLASPPLFGWGAYVKDIFPVSCTFDFYSHTISNKTYMLYLMVTGYFAPVFLMGCIYFRIYRRISLSKRYLLEQSSITEMVPLTLRECRRTKSSSELPTIALETENIRESRRTASLNNLADEKLVDEIIGMNRYADKRENVPIIAQLDQSEVKFANQAAAVVVSLLFCWTPYALITILCQFDPDSFASPILPAITLMMAKSAVLVSPVVNAAMDVQLRGKIRQIVCQTDENLPLI